MGEESLEWRADHYLSLANSLLPTALERAKSAKSFTSRWKAILSLLECLPSCLSGLSSHPCFSKNKLCEEQLQSLCKTLKDLISLASSEDFPLGKLQMQSGLDAIASELHISLRDCNLLIKTEVLGEVTMQQPSKESTDVRELLARLQLGHSEAKHRALDEVLEAMKEDLKGVVSVLSRRSLSALVNFLTATSPKVKEKAATAISILSESTFCESLLLSEGAIPPLIKLAETGTRLSKEKAIISLQLLSKSPEAARAITTHGGILSLVEIFQTQDLSLHFPASVTLKNLSLVPDIRQNLSEEGTIELMISLLEEDSLSSCKEQAAEFLRNITVGNDSLRRAVISHGGLKRLVNYLNCPMPKEAAAIAVKNLVGCVSTEELLSLDLLPRLREVLRVGSAGAQQAAASTICKISSRMEMKRLIGEEGFLRPLVSMLKAKDLAAREAASQALASLICCPQNAVEVKREGEAVPSLVHLLDLSPCNGAKKYAVCCLLVLSPSKRCKKLMISYGAIGYLKKLCDMDVPGSKKLLDRLQRGKLRSLFAKR